MDHSTTEITRYKDFTMEANPPRLGHRTWGTFLIIGRENDPTKRRVFDDDKTFASRLDAVRHSFALGRRIVDGEEDGRSVEDL